MQETACNTGDMGWFDLCVGKIPWRAWQPLQYFCLENPHDKGAMVHGITKSRTQLSTLAHTYSMAI